MRALRAIVLAGFIGPASMAGAADLHIQAEFTPDATSPGANRFVNKTPSTGLCQTWPHYCANRFSLMTTIGTLPIAIAADAPVRDSGMIRVSTDTRNVDVTRDDGTTRQVSFGLSDFSARYHLVPSASALNPGGDLAGHGRGLWQGGSWYSPPTGCSYTEIGMYSNAWLEFLWGNPSGAQCGKIPVIDIPRFQFSRFAVSYLLTTPNPLTMPSGTYTGQLTYSVGPGGDIDFGDASVPTDDSLTFHFTLRVNHILNIRFPPGADRLSLNPAGGWARWLNTGRIPDKLTAYQDFEIWSSGNFKMQLRCEHSIAGQCAIANPAGNQVPVATRLTLPAGLTSSAGAINEQLLDEATPLLVASSYYVDNGRARLHFEVDRNGVTQMTGQAGTQYTGDVTVIWDSEI